MKLNSLLLIFLLLIFGESSFAQRANTRSNNTCQTFTWDNATVYFLLIDRFNNGDATNDAAYGRQSDPAGGFMGGDFKGITQKITEGYFDNLGVDALWITAPYEQMHGYVSGYGSDPAFQKHYAYHGYYPLDFTQPDAAYGTKNEFRALVDSAHAHGIRIVVDIVMNHLAYDNQGDVNEYLGGFSVTDKTNAGWCNWWGSSWIRKADGYCATAPGSDDLTMSLAGLPDVKTEIITGASSTTAGLPPLLQTKWGPSKENRLSTEISSLDSYFTRTSKPKTPRHYIIKWLTDWVREYGIDGFRIDTYKHVGRDAWGELNDEADVALADWKAANPTKKLDDRPFWSVGEWWGHGIGKNNEAVTTGKTDALINFNFKGVAGSPTTLNATYSNYASTLNTDPTWNVLSYISSHDDGMFDRNNLINAGTSLLLAPGGVQIYYGDETARPLGTVAVGTDQPTRSFMNWNSINTTVLSHWQKLGKFRKSHPAIGAGAHTKIADSPFTFSRTLTSNELCGGCDNVVVVLGASGSTTVNVSSVFTNGTLLRDAYTGNTATVSSGNVTFTAGSQGIILIENPAGCVVCTPPTEIPTVTANPTTINYGESTTLTATGCGSGQTLEWESGQTSTSITVLPTTNPAIYKARCVGADGCKGTLSAGTNITVNNIPALTVYFKRPNSWTAIPRIYSWTGTSTAQSGAWPGTAMTLHCGNWYKYTFTAGLTDVNMIFNDGTGTTLGVNKTPDIMGVAAESRYDGTVSMNATTMTAGAPTDCPCIPPTEVPTITANPTTINLGQSTTLTASGCAVGQTYKWETGQTTTSITASPTVTTTYKARCVGANNCEGGLSAGTTVTVNGGAEAKVFFKLPSGWTNPKIHYWNVSPTNPSAPNTTWPGLGMVDEGNGWYSYTFPSGTTSANIVFNNNGSGQTNDLSISNFAAWFMTDCAGTVNGKLGTNGNWVFADPRTTQTGTYDVFLNNVAGWANPHAYVYTVGGGGSPAWPGTAMTLVSGTTFKITLSTSPVCIIFNNNGSPQTNNLSTANPGGTWNNSTNVWTPNCVPPTAPTLSASPSTVVSGNSSTLSATGCAGTVSWYASLTGGTALGTGNSFTTPALTTNTTYYADCASSASCVSASRSFVLVTVNTCNSSNISLVGNIDDISSGIVKHETDGTITATNKIIGSNANVKYDSKKSITLNAGFEIRASGGNVFQAYIDGCGNQ
ncbi:MAG: starch-binding protein [Spirosomaceae bacterium]|nr:starch-binding protein [Spirosomataceae bacterium]